MSHCSRAFTRIAVLTTIVATLASSTSASAQPVVSTPPWQRGVTTTDQRAARDLFREAANLHAQLYYKRARRKYQAALQFWDNPFIHIELAGLLMKLDNALSAYNHLREFWKWGAALLPEQDRKRARELERVLLEQHLAIIEVRCDEPGAVIALDGHPLFMGPGEERRVVRPDVHVLTAEKPGYYPVVKPLKVLSGNHSRVSVALSEDRLVSTRRWRMRIPWQIVGLGTAMLMGGGVVNWRTNENYAKGSDWVSKGCADANRCTARSSMHYNRAKRLRPVAIGAYVIGGTVLATGLAMAWRNRQRSRRRTNNSRAVIVDGPVVWRRGVGLSASYQF